MKRIDKKILLQYPLRKRDLARLYFPNVCAKSALRELNRSVHRAKGLLPELEAMGYSRAAHYFTRPLLETMLQYLGEPYGTEDDEV